MFPPGKVGPLLTNQEPPIGKTNRRELLIGSSLAGAGSLRAYPVSGYFIYPPSNLSEANISCNELFTRNIAITWHLLLKSE